MIGFVLAMTLTFVCSKHSSDDLGERIVGSILMGALSWLFIITVIAVFISRKKHKNGER